MRDATVARARKAMALRGAVLPVLAGVPLTTAEADLLARATPASWQLLATAECCALPLARRLREAGLLGTLAGDVRAVLAAAELRETQRVMAARAQLLVLDAVAHGLGIQMTVLKGGALVAERDRAPLDLGDVDVLTSREDAARVWRALMNAGWRERRGAGVSAMDPQDTMSNHFIALFPPGDGIAVELHERMRYDGGAEEARQLETRPLRGYRSLRRPIGAASVASMIEHSVIPHPHRRGHLRDLVLLGDALSECSTEERMTLGELLDGVRFAPELRDMLAAAEALDSSERMADTEGVRRAVARKYLLALGADRWLGERVPTWWQISYAGLERRSIRRAAYADLLRTALTPIPAGSPFNAGGLARRAPRLVGVASRLARAAYRVALTAVIAARAPSTRRNVDAVLQGDRGA